MPELRTSRTRLVASTTELVRFELYDRDAFARSLAARVPAEWPPDEAADAGPWFLEQLERAGPRDAGWFGYYAIAEPEAVLVGGGGTLGPPVDGLVEIGYSVLPAFQRRGFALEMMTAVIGWIWTDPRVREITAETDRGNVPSRNLLERLGFAAAGPGRETGSLRFARYAQHS